jgi:hypothetical protein
MNALQLSVNLTLTGSLPAMNRVMRIHWSQRHRWYRIVGQEVAVLLLASKQKPPTPWPRVRITAVRHSPRSLDFDGLVASLKPAVDALVRCGVMVDDTWQVTGQWDVSQQKCKGTLARWEIRVECVTVST